MNTNKTLKFFYWTIIAITTIGACGWILSTYPYADDPAYAREALPASDSFSFFGCEGDLITSWSQVWPSIKNHFIAVNSRIPNLLLFPMQLLPRWLNSIIMGLLIALMLPVMMWGGRERRSDMSLRYMAAAAILLWSAFPWYDEFQSLAYIFNYVPDSILMVITVVLAGKTGGSRQLTAACVCGFLTGCWHEGYGAVMLFVLATMWLVNKPVRRQLIPIFICSLAGFAIFALSGTMIRATAFSQGMNYSLLPYLLTRFGSMMWPVGVAFILLAFTLWKKRGNGARKLLVATLPWVSGAIAGTCMLLIMMTDPRVGWPGILCSVMIILLCVSTLTGQGHPGKSAIIVAGVCCAMYALWFVGIIIVQNRISEQQKAFEIASARISQRGDGVVFVDMSYYDIPFWTMQLPNNIMYAFSMEMLNRVFHLGSDNGAVMPAVLEGKEVKDWPRIPGDNDLRGSWPWVLGEKPHGHYDPDCGCYRSKWIVTVGDILPAFTPINRLLLALKGDRKEVEINAAGYPVKHGKDTLWIYESDPLPRTMDARVITRIDTVPGY